MQGVDVLTKLVCFLRCVQNLDGSNQTDTSEPSKPMRPLLKTANTSFFFDNAVQTEDYNYAETLNTPINFS